MPYDQIPSDDIIQKTVEALALSGIKAIVVDNAGQAKAEALKLIPQGAEVMPMTSITLEQTGIAKEINESGNYNSVRNQLNKLDRATQGRQMQQIGAAPEYALGSAHAVTEDGKVLIASNTGSQLPAYAYGSSHVVWVVGAQKIVSGIDTGMKRIRDYVLPKESARARAAYGLPDTWNSNPSKILIVDREVTPNRITMIIVKEVLGF
jgi:hypothetical protein